MSSNNNAGKSSLGSHLGKSLRKAKAKERIDDDNRSRGLTDLQWEMDLEGANTLPAASQQQQRSPSPTSSNTKSKTSSSTTQVPASPMQAPKRPSLTSPHARTSRAPTTSSRAASEQHMMSMSMSSLPHVPSLMMDRTSTRGTTTRGLDHHEMNVNEGSTSTIDVSNSNHHEDDDNEEDRGSLERRAARGTSSGKNNASLRAILELGAQQTKTIMGTPGKEDLHSVALEDFHKYDDYVKKTKADNDSDDGMNDFSARQANQNILNKLNYTYNSKDAKKAKRVSQFFNTNPLNRTVDQSVNLMDADAAVYSQRSSRSKRTKGGSSFFWSFLFGSNTATTNDPRYDPKKPQQQQTTSSRMPYGALLCVAIMVFAVVAVVVLPQQLDRLQQQFNTLTTASSTSSTPVQGGAAVLTSALLGPFTPGSTAAELLNAKTTNSIVANLQNLIIQHGVSPRATIMAPWHSSEMIDGPKTPQHLALLWWSQLDDGTALIGNEHLSANASNPGPAFGQRQSILANGRDVEHQHVLQRYALATLFFATGPPELAGQADQDTGDQMNHVVQPFITDMTTPPDTAGVGGGGGSSSSSSREINVRSGPLHRRTQDTATTPTASTTTTPPATEPPHPMSNWLLTPDVCTWGGIVCTPTGLVKELNLSGAKLAGELPTQELITTMRSSLKRLDLSHNHLSGSLYVPSMTPLFWLYLEYCDVRSNALAGKIPSSWLVHSPQLQTVHLESNQLTGLIPGSLCSAETNQFHPQQTALTFVAADCKQAVTCGCCNECY